MSPTLGAAPLPGFPRVHLSQGAPACHQLLHQPLSLRLPRPDAGAEATVRGFRSALDVSLEPKRQGPVAKPPPFLRGSTDSALTCQGTRAREALCAVFLTQFWLGRRRSPRTLTRLDPCRHCLERRPVAAQVRASNLLCCRGPSLQLASCSPGGSWRPGGTQQHFLLLGPLCSGALRLAVSATPHHFPPGQKPERRQVGSSWSRTLRKLYIVAASACQPP